MADSMDDILHPGQSGAADFPHAPAGWTKADATLLAENEAIELSEAHWEVVRALQAFYARQGEHGISIRALHDALGERFHTRGGMRFLYQIFPGGPVAQGCRLSGLKPPPGSEDPSFGSVQ